ncbi:dihydrodipicolinate synthase family protein [Thermococcus thioreducens]|uniref:4-hydroxy-tetrahydrodipicolinate synthase n=1 Tax=Thermococcus thioreducens TaxID=277988 RepID=A0A0Q2XP06_9EURY|nr:dihydrodipicolinate synthase family protein [Thermococcus thioreducens]ASJ12276.1 dihydrodipicolinate synthase family protein [Thermococcus thioreducens]KQH83012.1 lyase [Thermococcus thioreducens]SEV93697.1 4-hydroxy-tetrahydrodipicolinate synthase [Thermococcus thioreducens]
MRGVIVPLVTPFNEDYSIDVPALEEHVEFLLKAGVHGVFINATTGEFTSLSTDEKKFLAEKGRELVTSAFYLVGTASSNTFEVIELTKHAQDIGADYAVIAPPYYCPLNDDALFRHYSIVAERTDIPIILYNIPSCANPLSVSLIKRLALEYSNIAGVKETIDSVNHVRDVILEVKGERKDFRVFTGLDQHFLNTLILGGDGGIMACANFAPEIHLAVWKAFQEKRFEDALGYARRLAKLSKVYDMASSFGSAIKLAMSVRGFSIKPVLRPPYMMDGDEVKEDIRKLLAEVLG